MRRTATLYLLCFLGSAGPAFGQSGIGLYWDGCSADVHARGKSFDCNSNTGEAFSLYATVILPADLPQMAAAYVFVDIWYGSHYLAAPPWWRTAIGECRANAISMTFSAPDVATDGCADLWQGRPVVSVFQPQVLEDGRRLRLNGVAAIEAGNEFFAPADGAELNVCRIRISRVKTSGDGSCGGCQTCGHLLFTQLQLLQPNAPGHYISNGAHWSDDNVAWWNGYCPPPDAVQNRSWGAIKGMYR